jgi:3-oxoacyl-[acyl-carrier-protein] synthase II
MSLPRRREVVITGVGMLSPCGTDVRDFWEAVVYARSAIRALPEALRQGAAVELAAVCAPDLSPWIPAMPGVLLDRTGQLALAASTLATQSAGLSLTDVERTRAGIYLGGSLGGLGMSHRHLAALGLHHQFWGPALSFSTACSSSTVAIGEACRAIEHGHLDVALCGGAESCFNADLLQSWGATDALAVKDTQAPERSMKAFSRNRTGLVLGEGAAMFVLEEKKRALARGAVIHAHLIGYASAAGGLYLARQDPIVEIRTMRSALADAHLVPSDVDYINAHGVGTVLGDQTEAMAINTVFGSEVPVSGTKGTHGHLMGASGALELITSILSIQMDTVPPTPFLEHPDPDIAVHVVSGRALRTHVDTVMTNAFAFGGNHASLVVSRHARRA